MRALRQKDRAGLLDSVWPEVGTVLGLGNEAGNRLVGPVIIVRCVSGGKVS